MCGKNLPCRRWASGWGVDDFQNSPRPERMHRGNPRGRPKARILPLAFVSRGGSISSRCLPIRGTRQKFKNQPGYISRGGFSQARRVCTCTSFGALVHSPSQSRSSSCLLTLPPAPFPLPPRHPWRSREHIGFRRNLWTVASRMRKTWRLRLRFMVS